MLDKFQKKTNNFVTSEAIDKLDNMYAHLKYYLTGSEIEGEFKRHYIYVRDTLLSLSKDKHSDHVRLAKKLKAWMGKRNMELEKDNIKLRDDLGKEKLKKEDK